MKYFCFFIVVLFNFAAQSEAHSAQSHLFKQWTREEKRNLLIGLPASQEKPVNQPAETHPMSGSADTKTLSLKVKSNT